MYQVRVKIEFENGEIEIRIFNFWGHAAAWIEHLAYENESLPATVTMKIVR